MGETGLHNPTGSLYCITGGQSGQMLKPLALEWLAAPTGVAVSPDDRYVYVCEAGANRVVRFAARPRGVWHAAVFRQFSGGMGPSAACCDARGRLFVAAHDFAGGDSEMNGKIYVLSAEGDVEETIEVPGPEITGITINPRTNQLYVTEDSTNSIYTVDVS